MKNKTKIAFLTTILSLGLVLGACGGAGNSASSSEVNPESSSSLPSDSSSDAPISSSIAPSSSSVAPSSSSAAPSSSSIAPSSSASQQSSSNNSSSSSPISGKHRVTFVVDGTVVDTFEVNDGNDKAENESR